MSKIKLEPEAVKSSGSRLRRSVTSIPTISIDHSPEPLSVSDPLELPVYTELEMASDMSLQSLQPPKSRSASIPGGLNPIKRRSSVFQELFQGSFSEGSRLNEEKAIELENQLKKLASAFSARTRKTKAKIRQPPTPSSTESESDISAVSETNLLNRLQACLPSNEPSRRPSAESTWAEKTGLCQKRCHNFLRYLSCKYVLDPQSMVYLVWLTWVTAWFLYNAWSLPLRVVFLYQTESNAQIWFIFDCIADIFYVIDILAFKSHKQFIREGFWVYDPNEARKNYTRSWDFANDLASLFPMDIIFAVFYTNTPWMRLPRILRITNFWELFQRLDSVLSSPHSARIAKTLLYMIYMIHLNASAYYALSRWEGINATEWTFNGIGNAYIRCFLFATKTATSIGKNPKPSNEIEYMFMTSAWMSGVFVFALLIGQIRDIIATATKTQTEYRQMCYTTFNYLHRFDVPAHLVNRVKLWLNYTWEQQKTLDESQILAQLPQNMQADLALHIHLETLGKVKLFQNCETAFLRELVLKLRSSIFLPGDYVCRKGEVGKEMYIIRSGSVYVVGGATGHDILATLSSGSVFGEIALLAIGGMTKRTADVRAAGFANLFVLSKTDLNQAIKDYPLAQQSLKKKAKRLIRENVKKERARRAELQEEELLKSNNTQTSLSEYDDEKVVIKTKPSQPKFVDTVLKLVDPSSKTAQYLKYGSKASDMHTMHAEETEEHDYRSYPPSPYFPVSDAHLSKEPSASFMADSSSEEGINLDFPFNTKNRTPIPAPVKRKPSMANLKDSEEEDNEVFAYNPGGFDTHARDDDDDDDVGRSPLSEKKRPPPMEARASSVYSSSSSGKSKFQLPRQFGIEVESDEDGDI